VEVAKLKLVVNINMILIQLIQEVVKGDITQQRGASNIAVLMKRIDCALHIGEARLNVDENIVAAKRPNSKVKSLSRRHKVSESKLRH
jgi:hypothetical protein